MSSGNYNQNAFAPQAQELPAAYTMIESIEKLPAEYPKRVLLAVTGLSPQVVTETLFALTQSADERFEPTEVHLITTADGAERARLRRDLQRHFPHQWESLAGTRAGWSRSWPAS